MLYVDFEAGGEVPPPHPKLESGTLRRPYPPWGTMASLTPRLCERRRMSGLWRREEGADETLPPHAPEACGGVRSLAYWLLRNADVH